MKIKSVQWNIGGAKIRKENKEGGYTQEGMSHIIDILKKLNPDIITLQETHSNSKNAQVKAIAKILNLPYFYNDEYDDSHLEKGQRLGQAIISRFPLSENKFELFYNPRYKATQTNGDIWVSHDKGITSCVAKIDDKEVTIQTLHLIPFRRFGIDVQKDESKQVRDDISNKIKKDSPFYLLQGDFNFDNESLKTFLPDIFINNLKEISQEKPTTPKGRKYDHVLYNGLQLKYYEVIEDVLTDHFPVYTEFEL